MYVASRLGMEDMSKIIMTSNMMLPDIKLRDDDATSVIQRYLEYMKHMVQQPRRQDRQPDSQEFDKTSSDFSIGIIRSQWISCFEVSPGGIVVKPGACSFDFRFLPSFGLAIEQQ
eukprot:gene1199-32539_t